jgi:hypothetical protein
MKDIYDVDVSQRIMWKFYDEAKEMAKFLDIKCKIDYLYSSFGFPYSTVHYRLYLDGDIDNIIQFKKKI